MRYVLAIVTLICSGILLLLGIGQRTFLAGPSEIRYDAAASGDAAYGVIPADAIDAEPGQPNVVVGDPDAFVAVGSAADIEAWVAPYAHLEYSVDAESGQLQGEEQTADADAALEIDPESEGELAPLDPRGSDLWLDEWSTNSSDSEDAPGGAANSLRVPVQLQDDQAVLVALDGQRPVPAEVGLAWVQDRATPWAGPLLVAGAVFGIAGIVLYILAIDHDRRGLGPRRGRKGPLQGLRNTFGKRKQMNTLGGVDAAGAKPEDAPDRPEKAEKKPSKKRGKASRVALPAVGLAVALGLSGCSASYWPSFGSDDAAQEQADEEDAATALPDDAAPVPVTPAQSAQIIERVSEAAAAGDESLDPADLESRFTGDALAQRTANYKIRSSVDDYGVVPPTITAKSLDYELVQSTESWPRTLFATVESQSAAQPSEDDDAQQPAESPSLALIMQQQTPHDNYKVSRVISLRGGITMPEAAPVEDGTALLADDLQSLVLPPGEVGSTFASVLQNGADSEGAELFQLDEDDPLLTKSGAAWRDEAAKKAKADGSSVKYSVSAEQGEAPPISLSTGVGGGLVSTTVIENRVEDSDGGRWKPGASGAATALSGLKGDVDRLQRQVAHQVLFYVPSADSGEKIQILGVTTEMVGASK